jgi:hypothetical protein
MTALCEGTSSRSRAADHGPGAGDLGRGRDISRGPGEHDQVLGLASLLIGAVSVSPVGNGPDRRALAGGPWLPHGTLDDCGAPDCFRGRREAPGGRQATQGGQVAPPGAAHPYDAEPDLEPRAHLAVQAAAVDRPPVDAEAPRISMTVMQGSSSRAR